MRKDLITQLYEQEKFYWWHRGKRSIVRKNLQTYRRGKKITILDIGCGTGMLLKELPSDDFVWGLDSSDQALDFCRKRGFSRLKKGMLGKKLPFRNKEIDVILMLDVLEHVGNEQKALEEIARILKPGGLVIITVPAYQSIYSYWDKMLGHYRRYNSGTLNKLFITNNFQKLKLSYFYSFLLPTAIIFRFIKHLFGKNFSSDFVKLPLVIHELLFRLCQFETALISKFPLPFGLSIIGVFVKNEQD
jgi:ubiquinone/menaquinone biosynthesis C-methylase UbiE